MALPTEEQAKRNPILKLVRELRKKTHGICDVGAGPWGFGVNTLSLSIIHVCVCLNPDPYNVPLPPEVKRYALTLQTSCDDPDGFLDTKVLSTEDLQQLSKDQDIVTRFMAKTLLEMSAKAGAAFTRLLIMPPISPPTAERNGFPRFGTSFASSRRFGPRTQARSLPQKRPRILVPYLTRRYLIRKMAVRGRYWVTAGR